MEGFLVELWERERERQRQRERERERERHTEEVKSEFQMERGGRESIA